MTYEEFIERVASHQAPLSPDQQSGLLSLEQIEFIVTAALETLRDCLAEGGVNTLPEEIRQLLPAELAGAGAQGLDAVGTTQSENPQVIGETRAASGGESTAESGQ
ncbi:MAG TPA: hypothetical protein VER55_05890 [Ardenticatenaceae bacterium]|nr:hypothetical protein [Ardenticatenaceae bacterium]